MFSKEITAAFFVIAIASSLIVASGGFVGSAFAAKKGKDSDVVTNTMTDPNGTDNSSSPKSQSTNAGDSNLTTGSANSISGKDLKSLSKCQSGAAKDGDLTLTEVNDCYGQVFNHGGQGQEQQKSSSLNGRNIGTMR
jgi:hypothetical protein